MRQAQEKWAIGGLIPRLVLQEERQGKIKKKGICDVTSIDRGSLCNYPIMAEKKYSSI